MAGQVRIYEYISDEGDVFYSFANLGKKVSPPVRLIMVDRLGTLPERHITQIRRESLSRARRTDSEPDEV